ncbi:MAG: hypothetical protein IJ849_08240 [Selenomonadaceae bacterium]|nr:hypothetical protein [Selenomonadaceae bacterium]
MGADDLLSHSQLTEYAKQKFTDGDMYKLTQMVTAAEKHAEHISAWRIECTLREFEKPDDRNVYFAWPVHRADESGALKDIRPEIEVGGRIIQPRDKSDGSKKKDKAKEERQAIIDAYTLIAATKDPDEDGVVRVTVQDFVDNSEEYFGREMKRASMYKKIRKYEDFSIEDSVVTPAGDDEEEDE